jgi:hypothetical protein
MATNKNRKIEYSVSGEVDNYHPIFYYKNIKIYHDPELSRNTKNLNLFCDFMDNMSNSVLEKIQDIVLYDDDAAFFYNSKMDMKSNFAGLKTSQVDDETFFDVLELTDSDGRIVNFEVMHAPGVSGNVKFDLSKADWGKLPKPQPDKLDIGNYKWPGVAKSVWGSSGSKTSLWDEIGK